jgi:pentose-5-phosphate-3-epimerase
VSIQAQHFYGIFRRDYSRQDILDGRVVLINPALITLIEGAAEHDLPRTLQGKVSQAVAELARSGVRTFHMDINYADYRGFGGARPVMNDQVFSPAFVSELARLLRPYEAFLNVHLLTGQLRDRLVPLRHARAGAICFQLEALEDEDLDACLDMIGEMGACASPVIETVGSENLVPPGPGEVLRRLQSRLQRVGMLTFQAAGTASRSSAKAGAFEMACLLPYLDAFRTAFAGNIQIQGGITTATIGDAVTLGARFLVCGTQIFRNHEGRTPRQIVAELLRSAADALCPASAQYRPVGS